MKAYFNYICDSRAVWLHECSSFPFGYLVLLKLLVIILLMVNMDVSHLQNLL